MSSIRWILPVLCASAALSAQSLGDLNSLVDSAAKYLHHGLQGTQHPLTPELCKISGDSGSADELMSRSIDVVHWKFLYRIDVGGQTEVIPDKPKRSIITECKRGVFGGLQYSTAPVTDAKTLENTWIGISLDDALVQLRARGYTRGFSKVTLARPSSPDLPDEYVYVFDCPLERSQVAISTQDASLVWTATY
jgi:hypothetical protein